MKVKEICGAALFDDDVQLSFRISPAELERNTPEQLGHLLLARIQSAREWSDKALEQSYA